MITRISTRALVLGAVLFGLGFSPAFATSVGDGAPGQDIADPSTPTEDASGGDGDGGYSEHPGGYNGGNGGDITVVTPGGPEGVTYTSAGGDGGNGADEEMGFCFGECDPQVAGNGGNGGDGGTVKVTLTEGTVDGDLTATSEGGKAGAGGMGGDTSNGAAGNGGAVTIKVSTDGVVMGDVVAKSLGGEGQGHDSDGHGGDVTVTISGTVNGDITASSDGTQNTAGEIKVAISGGVVTGIISADTANSSSLSFKFQVSDRAEFNAATQALTGSGAEGHVTINGNLYRWEGFSALIDLLSYVGPEDTVEVSVQAPSEPASVNSTPEPVAEQPKPQQPVQVAKVFGEIPLITGKPEMAKCSGASEVRTVRQDDGSIVVIHHKSGEDTLIGQLKDGEFHRTNAAQGWDVQVGNQGQSVDVTNGGSAVSSCSFS